MSAADPCAALAAYLKTTAVETLTSGRVFRPELDDDLKSSMPVACVVIRRAGGYGQFGLSLPPVGDPRLDIFCWASTWHEAERLASEVISALRALRTRTFEHTRLMWARIDAGPLPLADPETDWPLMVVSTQVAHCEVSV